MMVEYDCEGGTLSKPVSMARGLSLMRCYVVQYIYLRKHTFADSTRLCF